MSLQKGDRVAVAMSGGVDSSVAAALAYESGFDVVGITLQLYDHGRLAVKKGACCAGQDIYDARTVADKIGFPHYVLDYESVFHEKVMENFVDSYLKGETPLPCVQCNQKVKFKDLLSTAKDLGAKSLVTGHYVQRKHGENGWELHRGADPARDQSYFLFTITPEQLDFLDFPLGGLPKTQTRDHARRLGLTVSEKPDSQDICFIPNGDYRSFVTKWAPQAKAKGHIVHTNGKVLGEHTGIINFTIGQRRGIGVSWPEPLYVISLNAEKQEVVVGPQCELERTTIFMKETNWLVADPTCRDVLVRIRSSQEPVAGRVLEINADTATIKLDSPETGISPGQACVVYQGTQVLGGGWITGSE